MRKLFDLFMNNFIARINWVSIKYLLTGREYNLTDLDRDKIMQVLCDNNCIILTWKNTHLTSYLISLSYFLITLGEWIESAAYGQKGNKPRFGKWAHACFNGESGEDPKTIRIREATGSGVHESRFEEIFNCDSVLLLVPAGFHKSDWDKANEISKSMLGRKYDTIFDYQDDRELSCVEYVYDAMERVRPGEFTNLLRLIEDYKTIHPDMLADCGDFHPLLLIER